MNDFEKYLKENKSKLNVDNVNPEIWLNIENKMLKKKNHTCDVTTESGRAS